MKKPLLALFLLLLPVFAVAKGAGYSNTQWGMTPAEVVAAENGKAILITPVQYSGSLGKAQIPDITIGSHIYTVFFLFDAADRLIQTNLTSNEKKNGGIIDQQFESLHQLLTQKYGEPQFKSANKVTWRTADTTIELSKIVMRGIMAQTSVRYIPNTVVSSDTSNL